MPNPRKSLKGQTFGHLEVLDYFGKAENGTSLWTCLCHRCNTEKVMRYTNLTYAPHKTKSCGCDRGRKRTLRPDRQPRNTPDNL
jgi:hypothetical protein